MADKNHTKVDILIIGGGIAGLFAAIKAREQGCSVTLVDKGYAGKSGSSPYVGHFAVFNPDWGHDFDAWMDHVSTIGEYLNNRDWTEILFTEGIDRFHDLIEWGVEFERDENGELIFDTYPGMVPNALMLKRQVFGTIMRKRAVRTGVKFVNRVMLTDLITADGTVSGAVGFSVDDGGFRSYQAKAVIITAGAAAFKPQGWPVSELTADGEYMAYRIGAEISGKEFNEPKSASFDYPAYTMGMEWSEYGASVGPPADRGPPQAQSVKCINSNGEEILGRPGSNFLEREFEAHQGRAPVYYRLANGELTQRVGGAATGLSVHTTEGMVPQSTNCESNIPGLFAAGDSCSTMVVGAVYPGIVYGSASAAVTGAQAGLGAASYIKDVPEIKSSATQLKDHETQIFAPTKRTGGFGPQWLTQILQNAMFPYYVLFVKHGDRLQATLTMVEFMRDHLAPQLMVDNPHDLRLAHEVKSMIYNAEAKLRTSLYREESRGTHYREDFPRRDDPDWLAWISLQREGEQMKLWKRSIPKKWWPDLTQPYEKLYEARMPGEKLEAAE